MNGSQPASWFPIYERHSKLLSYLSALFQINFTQFLCIYPTMISWFEPQCLCAIVYTNFQSNRNYSQTIAANRTITSNQLSYALNQLH